eukprot:COSAG04_NODE_11212_length_723_cov_0.850962_1_plen_80_part_01
MMASFANGESQPRRQQRGGSAPADWTEVAVISVSSALGLLVAGLALLRIWREARALTGRLALESKQPPLAGGLTQLPARP